jgi:MATE family multidrug resistance protein
MFIATLLHIPLCYLFVDHFDLDIRGLGLASSTKDFVLLLSVMIYANCNEQVRPALSLPDSSSFSGWGEYLKISLPGTVMMCAEWWAFELLVLLSGILGVPE